MKNQLMKMMAVLAVATFFASCSNDDETAISGTGNLEIEYDNAFKNNDLILGTQANTTSLGEVLHITAVKYIISNIVLTDESGNEFVYPKNQSYFVVDESAGEPVLELENIPAGNYTKVRFGIGVDQQQYDLGEAEQGDFLATALSEGLASTWSEGYRNVLIEGNFTSPTVASSTDFTITTHKPATGYNYAEVTLNLPEKALVRTTITPEIHIIADVSKTIDGTNKIALSDHIGDASASTDDDATIELVLQNLSEMFSVAHVHND